MNDKKKLAAISTAISAYISAVETERASASKPADAPLRAASAWRVSGLQETMQMRRMIQLRFIRSGR